MGDDIIPSLDEKCIAVDDPVIESELVRIGVHLNFDNEYIKSFIEKDMAEYCCEVNGSSTYYREIFRSKKPDFVIEIPRSAVKGRLVFTCSLVVTKTIEDYANPGFNEDYDGASFLLECGDKLIDFPPFRYNMDVKYDKLFAAGSIMKFNAGTDDSRETSFNLEGNIIYITIPPKMYEKYRRHIQGDLKLASQLHSSVVMSALTYALLNLYNPQYTGKTWADALQYRISTEPELQEYDLSDLADIMKLAQRLLGDPFKRMFDVLAVTEDSDV